MDHLKFIAKQDKKHEVITIYQLSSSITQEIFQQALIKIFENSDPQDWVRLKILIGQQIIQIPLGTRKQVRAWALQKIRARDLKSAPVLLKATQYK